MSTDKKFQESRCSYREESVYRMPVSDGKVLPMTDPWMQNEDFCWGGSELAVDQKCRTGPFHSVLCRLWLES